MKKLLFTSRTRWSPYHSVFPIHFITAVVLVAMGWFALPAQAQLPTPDYFPIGVFAQPVNFFDRWKSRGINTMFQYEGQNNSQGIPTTSMETWSATAASKGLYYARLPSANPANDLQEKFLIAWTQKDEPDLENHDPVPQNLIDKYQNLKAISPSKPVWVNFAGNHITPTGANYTSWVKGGDWLSFDWYPFNADPNRYTISLIGKALDKLRADAKGVPKKYFAIIESSNQKLVSMSRKPTVDEFRGEIWEAIVHGATGILYFPQQIGGGFQYDATPPELVTEMTTQNARIKSLGLVLNGVFNPPTRGYSSSLINLEATWRTAADGDYFFVLNQANTTVDDGAMNLVGINAALSYLEVVGENRTVPLVAGQIIDDFTPYQVHVYRAPANPGAPLPEPGSIAMLALGAMGLLLKRKHV